MEGSRIIIEYKAYCDSPISYTRYFICTDDYYLIATEIISIYQFNVLFSCTYLLQCL